MAVCSNSQLAVLFVKLLVVMQVAICYPAVNVPMWQNTLAQHRCYPGSRIGGAVGGNSSQENYGSPQQGGYPGGGYPQHGGYPGGYKGYKPTFHFQHYRVMPPSYPSPSYPSAAYPSPSYPSPSYPSPSYLIHPYEGYQNVNVTAFKPYFNYTYPTEPNSTKRPAPRSFKPRPTSNSTKRPTTSWFKPRPTSNSSKRPTASWFKPRPTSNPTYRSPATQTALGTP